MLFRLETPNSPNIYLLKK